MRLYFFIFLYAEVRKKDEIRFIFYYLPFYLAELFFHGKKNSLFFLVDRKKSEYRPKNYLDDSLLQFTLMSHKNAFVVFFL